MKLSPIDLSIVVFFLVVWLVIGVWASKRASRSRVDFFLSGRSMPWWLLGVSMVATTFSTDTPNLVTDIVRTKGVSGNWLWWAFLLTGMLTTFVYARLWRRSAVTTDIEFYELRYSGKVASFLRGFRSLHLGVFFNCIILATVSLAAIKIGSVMVGASPIMTLVVLGGITALYSMLGGLTAVVITDVIQFTIAMVGAVAAAVVALNRPEVGGIEGLFSHPNLVGKTSILPDFSDWNLALVVFVVPLAIQWWATWYPGAEPGGGGYVAQRMLAAKDETNAQGATLLFNFLHYAVRPWPWIIVALCSLLVYPTMESLREAYPHVSENFLKDDLAYSAMLAFLPPVWMGIVVASLAAAYMSTVSTHLNWGSSYIVNDFYLRFINPHASEKKQVLMGRLSTIGLMVLAGFIALNLQNAQQMFFVLLQIGAGTGLLYILRWFWWRINPWSELTAMVVSALVAVYFHQFYSGELSDTARLLIGIAITTLAWVSVTLITPPSDENVLRNFYAKTRPSGLGWKAVLDRARAEGDAIAEIPAGVNLPLCLLCMSLGCVGVWGFLFGVGFALYGFWIPAMILMLAALFAAYILMKLWPKLSQYELEVKQ